MTTATKTREIVAQHADREPAPNETTSAAAVLHSPSLTEAIRSALLDMPLCQPGDSKDQIRSMHEAARQRHLADHEKWTRNAWRLRHHLFADGADLNPEAISPRLLRVVNTEQRDLFRLARYTWSLPYSRGYGRRLRFLIVDAGHDNAVMAILGLQSPPIDFPLRDQKVDYLPGQKVEMVNQTMDIYTLGAVPPYNHLLSGKLAVYAAASLETREAYQDRYSGAVTQIEGRVLPAHLVMLTTTSAFGRSSLYNRIRYQDREVAQRLGETTGYGNVRLNAVRDIYPQIKNFLIREGYQERMGFGKGGPKEAWRNITQVMQMLGIKGDDALHHGIRREAWGIPLAENVWRYLSGQSQQPAYYEDSFVELAQHWRERWMLPRSERDSRWCNWRREQILAMITPETDRWIHG